MDSLGARPVFEAYYLCAKARVSGWLNALERCRERVFRQIRDYIVEESRVTTSNSTLLAPCIFDQSLL